MAVLECRSSKRGVDSAWVEVENITDEEVSLTWARLDAHLARGGQISTAVADAFVELTELAPNANPSDLWQHVIYRRLLEQGWSDNQWKRVSGFALERVFVKIYQPRMFPHGIRIRILSASEANMLLSELGVSNIRSSKFDLFIEGNKNNRWHVFGAAHAKSSIAERIQDDVPASAEFMKRGLVSIALTMDAKSYPPPHGNCVNYGELGGRSFDVEKDRIKRNYIEVDGQFDGLFSFNLRTPPSQERTNSGKKIHTMSLHENQPDQLVHFLVSRWMSIQSRL